MVRKSSSQRFRWISQISRPPRWSRPGCAPGRTKRCAPRTTQRCIITRVSSAWNWMPHAFRHTGKPGSGRFRPTPGGQHRPAGRSPRGETGRPSPASRGAPCPPRSLDRIPADLDLLLGVGRDLSTEVIDQHLAPRQMPRKGLSSLSGTESQSVARRTNSSESFALIGPPKTTAPRWASRVSGNGSPSGGRRMSSWKPCASRSWPTRPGLDPSW